MADDHHPPEPVDPIGPDQLVPNPEPPPESWEDDTPDPDAEDRPAPKDDLTPDQYATDPKDAQVDPVVSDLQTNLAIEDLEDIDGVGPLEAKVRIPLYGSVSA